MALGFLRSIWFWISISIIYVLLALPALFFGLLTGITRKNFPLGVQSVGRLWAWLVLLVNGIQLKTEGHYPFGPGRVYLSNHQSLLDILVLTVSLPLPFYFVAKQSLFKIPVLGQIMRAAGYMPLNRENAHQAYETIEQIVGKVKSGSSMILFPEGTRSNAHMLGAFKRGSINIAYKAQADIYPVLVDGSYLPFQKGIFNIQSAKITVKLPGAIPYNEFKDQNEKEFVKKLEDRMRNTLG